MQAKKDPHFALYNVEFYSQIDDTYCQPTLENFLEGKPFKMDCYVGKIPESQIPDTEADDLAYSDFLFSIFEQKDRIRKQSSWEVLQFGLVNILMTGSLFVYGLYTAFILESLILKLAILTYVVLIFSAIIVSFKMVAVSNYGIKNEK